MLLGSILSLCLLSSTILLQSSSADEHEEFSLMRHFYNVCIFKDYLLAFVLTLRFSKALNNCSCIQDTTTSGRGSNSGHIIFSLEKYSCKFIYQPPMLSCISWFGTESEITEAPHIFGVNRIPKSHLCPIVPSMKAVTEPIPGCTTTCVFSLMARKKNHPE